MQCQHTPTLFHRHYDEWPVVHRQILMCFRAIIHKTDAHSLAPFWPLIVTELMHILAAEPKGEKGEGYGTHSRILLLDCAFS